MTKIVCVPILPAYSFFSLGRQFMVDNRPSASGFIGTNLIARAVPVGQEVLQALAVFWQWLPQWSSRT
jgi:tripartite-type tricarboxylate transporter receptor subunit TctC